jgi:hypothetical protein
MFVRARGEFIALSSLVLDEGANVDLFASTIMVVVTSADTDVIEVFVTHPNLRSLDLLLSFSLLAYLVLHADGGPGLRGQRSPNPRPE